MGAGGWGRERNGYSIADMFTNLMPVREVRTLRVYQQVYDAATQIFERLRIWPKEETDWVTDQSRRFSRFVFANNAEAWGKRPYGRHVVSKRSDADAKAADPKPWLQFGHDGGCLATDTFGRLDVVYNRIYAVS